jgi:23S rRNA (uracil1939-C5)-methyltransferase
MKWGDIMKKNDSICAVCEGVGSSGEGIIRHEGVTFFVPSCLPGEKVRFKVLKLKDSIGYGKVEEVLAPAEERVQPQCPAFLRCGGCRLQHVEYLEQLKIKSNIVRDCLKKIAGIEREIPNAIKSDLEYGYRNKLQLPVGVNADGEDVIGFYAERSHRIIPIDSCAIHPEWAEKLIAIVKSFMRECGVHGYDEVRKTGTIRHIVAREIAGSFIFTLVVADSNVTGLDRLIALLQRSYRSFSFYLNVNAKDTNVIFGEEFRLLYGAPTFEGVEQGIRYEAGPVTFLQVNENVRAKLYRAAVKTVTGEGGEVVIDAYSGGGLLTAMIAKKAKRVYGIELEKEAVACANSLKEKNNLKNMTNICGYVEQELSDILEKEKDEKVRLILDPPRAGIARSVIKALCESGIPKLTIISCNPATLARDLGLLTGYLVEVNGELKKSDGNGAYEISFIQPYDMFPQTKHVETLVQLSQKNRQYN